jgi:hypothetical protein
MYESTMYDTTMYESADTTMYDATMYESAHAVMPRLDIAQKFRKCPSFPLVKW